MVLINPPQIDSDYQNHKTTSHRDVTLEDTSSWSDQDCITRSLTAMGAGWGLMQRCLSSTDSLENGEEHLDQFGRMIQQLDDAKAALHHGVNDNSGTYADYCLEHTIAIGLILLEMVKAFFKQRDAIRSLEQREVQVNYQWLTLANKQKLDGIQATYNGEMSMAITSIACGCAGAALYLAGPRMLGTTMNEAIHITSSLSSMGEKAISGSVNLGYAQLQSREGSEDQVQGDTLKTFSDQGNTQLSRNEEASSKLSEDGRQTASIAVTASQKFAEQWNWH